MLFGFKNKNRVDESKPYRQKALDKHPHNNGYYVCAHCGRKIRKSEIDVDHIVPQSKGGGNESSNLQILCAHCNRSKRADMSQSRQDLRRNQRDMKIRNKQDNARQKIRKCRDIMEKAAAAYPDKDLLNWYKKEDDKVTRNMLKREIDRRGLTL
jgi:hypothetical protein